MRRFANDRVQGIMRTLGFDDDTALESKMVSCTIQERPVARRGLQLRHPQARRRVRRRHQPPARDDLPRARPDPALVRPRPDRGGHARGRGRLSVAEHTAGDHRDDWNSTVSKQLSAMVLSLANADLRVIDEARRAGGPERGADGVRAGAVRAQARRDRRAGYRSWSGLSCSASSTRCGSSTSPPSTTCGAASGCGPIRSATR